MHGCSSRSPVQLVRKLGGDAARLEALKLHRPLAAYTSHPLWPLLSGPHCSFEEACSLLAGGLAADFLEQPPSGRVSRHGSGQQAAAPAAAAAAVRRPAAAQAAAAAAGAPSGAADEGAHDGSGSEGRTRSGRRNGHVQPAGRRNTIWQGLEPHDSGTYSLGASASLAGGRASNISIPGAMANFNGAAGMLLERRVVPLRRPQWDN